ncbi:MAG TPA: hypothetical protein PLB10_18745 [Thiolinea sp.]|nr:hypothetical protein [Thiolinea sp.]
MALLVVGFCWAHKTGEWKHKVVKPLKIKKHGRPEQSLFRYGLGYLSDILLHGLRDACDSIRLLVLFLWPPNKITLVDAHTRDTRNTITRIFPKPAPHRGIAGTHNSICTADFGKVPGNLDTMT